MADRLKVGDVKIGGARVSIFFFFAQNKYTTNHIVSKYQRNELALYWRFVLGRYREGERNPGNSSANRSGDRYLKSTLKNDVHSH